VPGDVRWKRRNGLSDLIVQRTWNAQRLVELYPPCGIYWRFEPLDLRAGPISRNGRRISPSRPQLRFACRTASHFARNCELGAATKVCWMMRFGRPFSLALLASSSGTSSPLIEGFLHEQALTPVRDIYSSAMSNRFSPSINKCWFIPDSIEFRRHRKIARLCRKWPGVFDSVFRQGPATRKAPDLSCCRRLTVAADDPIGGALAWETPQTLAPFASESPSGRYFRLT